MTLAIIASFFGGVLPAILWLEFWLRQGAHREPRHLIVGTFVLGMMSVFVAGPLEQISSIALIQYTFASFLLWALIEESVKFGAAHIGGLRSRFCDDPVDPSIYLITAALGFAAAENILFLFDSISAGNITHSILTITFRFVGATVLHVIASGAIGIAMGFAFYRHKATQRFALIFGFILSVLLHAAFNSFIISSEDKVIWVFAGVWILLIALILILEKIKTSKKIIQIKSS